MSFKSRLKKAAQNIPAMMDLYEAHTISNTQEEKENLFREAATKLKVNGITNTEEAVQTVKDAKKLVSAVGAAMWTGIICAIVD